MDAKIDNHRKSIPVGVLLSGWLFSFILLVVFYACIVYKPSLFARVLLSPTGMAPEYEEASLHHAIMTNNDQSLSEILAKYPHLANSTPAMVGRTRYTGDPHPIITAARFGTSESIAILARAGANLDFAFNDMYGYTPLHDLILQASPIDPDSDHNNDPDRPARRLRMARALLENGANPNARDKFGRTPLFRAGVPESVDLLIQYGADPAVRNNKGDTAFLAMFKDLIPYRLTVIIAMARHKDKFDFKAKDLDGMAPKDYLKRRSDGVDLNRIIINESGVDVLGM